MRIEKRKIVDIPGVYVTAELLLGGKKYYAVASENRDEHAYIIDSDTLEYAELWNGETGVMNIVQIPGTEKLLCITEFYPVFQSREAKICLLEMTEDGPMHPWKLTPVLNLPFCHRIGVFTSDDGINHLVACSLCRDKDFQEDWSKPGAVYFGNISDEISNWHLTKQLDGLTKNHGLCIAEGKTVYVTAENGVFRFDCSGYKDGDECVAVKLSDVPTSDICVCDFGIATIEPFHGNTVRLYDHGMNILKEWMADFCHVVWCGIVGGCRSVIIGNRGGDKDLTVHHVDDDYKAVLDYGVGPTQISVMHHEDKDVIISADHGAGKTDIYELME